MGKNKNVEKKNGKPLKKKIKKLFKPNNIVKIFLVVATLALILGSVLPYLIL
jgi:hypothetical protein